MKTFLAELKKPFSRIHDFFLGDTKGIKGYDDPISAYQARPRRWIMNLIFLVTFIGVFVFMSLQIDILSFGDRPINWEYTGRIFRTFFTWDGDFWAYFFGFSQADGGWTGGVLYNILITFAITFVATLISFFIGIPFGILASHRLFGRWAYISEIFLILIRTIPEILLALFLIRLSGYHVLTAIIALAFHSIGMIGKLYADQIDGVDFGPMEALESAGANKFQQIRYGLMPEVMPNFISVGLYRLDINIRTGTMLGLIIQQDAGIGWNVLLHFQYGKYQALGADTLGIVLLIVMVDLFSSYLRKVVTRE